MGEVLVLKLFKNKVCGELAALEKSYEFSLIVMARNQAALI
jgi:hypothetical protein